jgi:cyclophilin family peptidyl-prolyl cis-trans isomerase
MTQFQAPPPMCISTDKTYTATVDTDVGTFTVALNAKEAPKTVNNFVYLSRYHFYDGVTFHRVIPDFVVQGGDPQGTGQGGPGYQFADELPKAGAYKVGSLAMANAGPNTNGSQFFIITGSQGTQLPPKYSLFGSVISGMDVVKKIEADGAASGTPTKVHKMTKVTITES